jgi:diketogulonate reductase-like aldo/keto reductase
MKNRRLGKTGLEVPMQPSPIAGIPGTTKLHRLDENIGAADIELTAEDIQNIESAVSAIAVQGERYPPQQAARIDR